MRVPLAYMISAMAMGCAGPVSVEASERADSRISEGRAAAIATTELEAIEGGLRVSHPLHVAEFTASGVRFVPRSGGPEWRWRLVAISREMKPFELSTQESVTPQSGVNSVVRYMRGRIEERYVPRQHGVEQQFVLHEPLELGGANLVITGSVQSVGHFEVVENGWQWRTKDGAVTLGQVHVFDARGKDLPAQMTVSKNSTRIEVDGAALARATHPVTIDPLIGTAFRISDMGPDGDSNFLAGSPAVAYNPNANEYFVVWHSDDDRGVLVEGETEIFGQRIDAATGAELGANDFRISDMGPNRSTAFNAFGPDVAYNPTVDEYLVVWTGDDDVGPLVDQELEVFGQRIDAATGAELGANDFRISDMGPDGDIAFNSTSNPEVVYNSAANEYLVVWIGEDDSGALVDNEREVYGQRIDGDTGAEIGANDFRISDMGPDGSTAFFVGGQNVVYNANDNEYLVVWAGEDDTGGLSDGEVEIFGQRLDGVTGAEVGANDFRISNNGPDGEPGFSVGNPAVVHNPTADEYLVVWAADIDPGAQLFQEIEIFGQRLEGATGAEVGVNDFRISNFGPDGDPNFAALEVAAAYNHTADEYLVVWTGDQLFQAIELFGQRLVGSSGAEVGPNDFLIRDRFAVRAEVAANTGNNEFLVVWQGRDDALPLEFEIYGRRVSAPPVSSASGLRLYTASLVYHQFTTVQRGPTTPFATDLFVARPLGTDCHGWPTAPGFPRCNAATREAGAPLTGSGTAFVEEYGAAFTIPRFEIVAGETGSIFVPAAQPITYVQTTAIALNDSGSFSDSGPYRGLTSTPSAPGSGFHRVEIHEGASRFGGTMRVLGFMGSNRLHANPYGDGSFTGMGSSLLASIGSGATNGGKGNRRYGTFTYTRTNPPGETTMADLTAWNWSWTTGTVTATVSNGDGFRKILRREGYDRRTGAGVYGTIKLVAPQIAHWNFPNRNATPWDRTSAAIGILRIVFLPEPSGWLMLVAGTGALLILARFRTH